MLLMFIQIDAYLNNEYAMRRAGVKACVIKCVPSKSQLNFEKPFSVDIPALMQNMAFSTNAEAQKGQ